MYCSKQFKQDMALLMTETTHQGMSTCCISTISCAGQHMLRAVWQVPMQVTKSQQCMQSVCAELPHA